MIDPTTRGDLEADLLRDWYEAHRETLAERLWTRHPNGCADEFMLGLINEVIRIRGLDDEAL